MLDGVALPGNKFTPFFLDDEKQTLKLQQEKEKKVGQLNFLNMYDTFWDVHI